MGNGGNEEGREDGGKGEPEHFVKQGKMRLRRGTTAAFLSLQNYVFRGPPPYLSKHNKFPLCVSRFSSAPALSSTGVSSFASFSFPPPVHREDASLSFFHTPEPRYTSAPRNTRSLSISRAARHRIRPRSLFIRASHQHPTPTHRWLGRLSADPSTSIVFLRRGLIQIKERERERVPTTEIEYPRRPVSVG